MKKTMNKAYKKTRKYLASPKFKSATKKVGNYFDQVNKNMDNTFGIPKKDPDYTLSNKIQVPRGHKLVRVKGGYRLVRK